MAEAFITFMNSFRYASALYFVILMVNINVCFSQKAIEKEDVYKVDSEVLLKQVCPDLYKINNEFYTKRIIKVRNLDSQYSIDPASTASKTVRLQNSIITPEYMILLIDVEDESSNSWPFTEVTLLAVFDKTNHQLVDILNVKTDRFTFIPKEVKSFYKVGKGRYAVLVNNHHFNSSQGYNNYSLFLLSNNILEVYGFFVLNLNTPCEYFTAKPTKIIINNSSKKLPDIDIYVNVKEKHICKNSKVLIVRKKIPGIMKASLIWSNKKRKYIDTRKDFERLTQFSEENL